MDLRDLGTKFSLFVVLSAALHIAAAAAIFALAPERKPPPEERAYTVRIVPPEPVPAEAEEKPPPLPPSPPLMRVIPPAPKSPERVARAPVARPEARALERKDAGPPGGAPEKEAPAVGEGAAPAVPAPAPAPKGAGRERLFDSDILAGVIGKREKPEEPESGITFDTREIRYYGYMRKLKERIEAVWEYPREAVEKGIYGDLVIKFVIRKDGTLGSVELVRTSGWKILDQAAIEALKDGSPYWPLPEDWGAESFTVTGHFIYSISGLYYVR